MEDKLRIGALISGGGTNLQAVINACESGKTDGRIVFVGSDNPEAKGLERAKKHGIPTFVVDYRKIIRNHRTCPDQTQCPEDFDLSDLMSKDRLFPATADPEKMIAYMLTRAAAEAQLLEQMRPYPFDLLILAGFMRKLTPYFIDRVNIDPRHPRIMNIHPALLPAFPGVDGYGDTWRYGCRVGGCTVHFIDYGEDSGPIIDQKAFHIEAVDTLDTVREKGLNLEWQLYPECIQLYARGRLETVKKVFDLGRGKTFQRSVVKILPVTGG